MEYLGKNKEKLLICDVESYLFFLITINHIYSMEKCLNFNTIKTSNFILFNLSNL